MKKTKLAIILLLIIGFSCQNKQTDFLNEDQKSFDKRMEWWRDATFGMFIHWGVYAVPAGIYNDQEIPGIGEWIMDRADIPIPEYEEFAKQFNPIKFDAQEWVKIAKDAGMKYIVITSKHHDGFALWDSEVSDYNIVDFTPYDKDVLKELSSACEKEGIKLCFYHSIMDWHHPDANKENFAKYRDEFMIPQLEELLSGKYGDIGVLWFDGEWIKEWTEEQGKELYKHLRSIKPDLIINNRVGKGRQGMQGMSSYRDAAGDFGTPEQEILADTSSLDWESCMTMNDTWGFKKNDHNWKSSKELIHNLIDVIAKGGNYLLNVGPTAEGEIPAASVERLADIGDWIKINKEAIYKTKMFTHFREGENVKYSSDLKGKTVYTYLLEWPGTELNLRYVKPMKGSSIKLLGYDGKLNWSYDNENGLTIEFPAEIQDPEKRTGKHAWVLVMKAEPVSVVHN